MAAIPAFESDLITTTLIEWQPQLFDNITNHNAFLRRLRKRGNIKHVNGGACLEVDIMYRENETVRWFSGADELLTTKQSTMQPAYFNWYLANMNMVIYGDEWAKNKGSKTRKYSLIESRKSNLEKSFQNMMNKAIWMATEDSTNKRLIGMPFLVSDTADNKVGAIDRSVAGNEFWKNLTKKPVDYGMTEYHMPTPDELNQIMSDIVISLTRQSQRPTVIFCSIDMYRQYEVFCTDKKRITTNDRADGSFRGLDFQGIEVLYDHEIAPKHMYFLNEEFIKLCVHPDLDFKLDLSKKPVNQYIEVFPMYFMGSFTISNCRSQGVFHVPVQSGGNEDGITRLAPMSRKSIK